MKALLTGASGFLGRHCLTALLSCGHTPIAVSRTRPRDAPDIEWLERDLLVAGEPRRLAREARADVALHLAWTAQPGYFWTDQANNAWIAASIELARETFEAGARRFCGVGTCFEYEWPENSDCHEATTPLGGHTLYDRAKSACFRAIAEIAGHDGPSLSWARLFYLYGPGEHPDRLVASVARALVAGKPANCSHGYALRDYMDARDAGAALAALATSDVSGAVNIASGERTKIADLASELGRLAGRPDLVRLGTLPDRPDDPPRITADIRRMTEEVGFRPRRLRQGLADVLDYWRKQEIIAP